MNVEATPEEAQVEHVEGEAAGDDSFNPFNEISDEFKPSAMLQVLGPDGLPQYVAQSTKSDIPPLSHETLVCMADKSEFVIRNNAGLIVGRYYPNEVYRNEDDGSWRVIRTQAEVEPIRPKCRHYVRQITQLEENPEHRSHLRLCSARRTTEGAFMSVRDCGMWACTMREPRDLKSEQLIDEFDDKKVAEGLTRVDHSIFSSKEG